MSSIKVATASILSFVATFMLCAQVKAFQRTMREVQSAQKTDTFTTVRAVSCQSCPKAKVSANQLSAENLDSEFQQSLARIRSIEKTFPVAPALLPVMGEITSRFGERIDPLTGERTFHPGLDIATRYGEAIRATREGLVVEAHWQIGYGRLVMIDHGSGITTWYGHLSAFHTVVGAHVRAGDIIGYEGRSGRSTGPHLHYEVRIYNRPVNPFRYFRSVNPEVKIGLSPKSAVTIEWAVGD